MWWLLLSLVWWCGTCAIPAPGPEAWKCPKISEQPVVECSCDMPHTLRCTGDKSAMTIIARTLRSLNTAYVSLLDCTVQNVSVISGPLLEGIALHGLVVSSGEIKDIHQTAFQGLASPLQALGLPNNKLTAVPTQALKSLPELDRLDLSSNKLKSLEVTSFKGLRNLSFIDLSDNVLTKIAPNTFENLPQLKILRLRGNRLTIQTISKLNPIRTVEEIDLSGNNLVGPIAAKTFPKMESLRDIQLSHNSLSSIKMGALQGLSKLSSLSLQHNQIDVLEDHAFSHLTSLVNLELAHNRIVAVSGASLAHLNKLTDLDLRHNFLRALTADLILPLKNLKNLRLDDNDISIVASDALKETTILKHLTLSENPLNCDCSLTEFAIWLNNSTLPSEDKASAVCTTPPSLENGLLVEVPLESLLCGEDEQETIMAPLSTPYKAKINLKSFKYDGRSIKLEWNVEDEASPYTCDAIIVYEEEGEREVLVESNPLKCNSSDLPDPKILNVTVPNSIQLQQEHRYRYCVVLFEAGQTDDVSLILGCSDIIPLVQNAQLQLQNDFVMKFPKVLAIQANLTNYGSLSISVKIYPQVKCEINLAILEQSALLSQRKINCSDPKYVFVGLDEGPYRVCANVIKPGPAIDLTKPRCVTVFRRELRGFTTLDVIFVSVFFVLCFMVIALIWGVRKVLLKPKIQTHQCFMPPEGEEQQHSRYISDFSKCQIYYSRSGNVYKDFFEITGQPQNGSLLDFHFSVMSASDAHILLAPSDKVQKADPVYEIVIGAGGNTFCDIRRMQKSGVKATIRIKGLLSALDLQSFWIHISKGNSSRGCSAFVDGVIDVGKEGEELGFLTWIDPDPLPLKVFSFSTWPGVEAKWYFDCPRNDNDTTNSKKLERPLSPLEKLRRDLLYYYDPYVRPVQNVSSITVVGLQLSTNIVTLDEHKSVLQYSGSVTLSWQDEKLKWNISDYDGINTLHIFRREIWVPDLFLFNAIDDGRNILEDTMLTVNSTGFANWKTTINMNSWCSPNDLGRWPRDEHTCDVVLGFFKDFRNLQLIFNAHKST
ncbi:slit -like 1 protein, partial [Asbolus verrucosus]